MAKLSRVNNFDAANAMKLPTCRQQGDCFAKVEDFGLRCRCGILTSVYNDKPCPFQKPIITDIPDVMKDRAR